MAHSGADEVLNPPTLLQVTQVFDFAVSETHPRCNLILWSAAVYIVVILWWVVSFPMRVDCFHKIQNFLNICCCEMIFFCNEEVSQNNIASQNLYTPLTVSQKIYELHNSYNILNNVRWNLNTDFMWWGAAYGRLCWYYIKKDYDW